MDFRLTDEQKQIQQMVRDFGASEIKPNLMKWDEAQHFPVDTFKKAGELGLLAVTFPESTAARECPMSTIRTSSSSSESGQRLRHHASQRTTPGSGHIYSQETRSKRRIAPS